MFERMGFGNTGFGSGMGAVSLRDYEKVAVPPEVTLFMSGQYVAGKYNEALPEQRKVQSYEDQMVNTINFVISAFQNFKPGNATLKTAQKISEDISRFKDYMILKMQVQNSWTTPTASNEFYSRYYGSFTDYSNANKWLNDQASTALQEMMDQGTMLMSDALSKMSAAKSAFYLKVIVPKARQLSKGDQDFIRDVFVLQMDGEVTLSDLVKALGMIKPIPDSYKPLIAQFAAQMVLGPNLSVGVLNSDSEKSYSERNVKAEVAEITGKYNAVASRLGSYLAPQTGALFQQHIDNWYKAYNEPNNPAYYVSPTGNQITQNFVSAVYSAIAPFIGGGGAVSVGDAIARGEAEIDKQGLSPEAAAQAKAMLRQATQDVSAQAQASGGLLPLLAIGGLALLFMRGKK